MLAQPELIEIKFENNRRTLAVQVNAETELNAALARLGIDAPRPTLALVGGTARLSREILFHLDRLYMEGIAPLVERLNAYAVDGGTDAGIIQMIGVTRDKIKGTFPLVGVAARGTILLPGESKRGERAWSLESHHTHFIFVPGSEWGDEVEWIARVAGRLAGAKPSATVLVNGGEISLRDVAESVHVGRPVIIAQGSGRMADALAGALRGEPMDERMSPLVRSGLLRAVPIEKGPAEFAHVIEEILVGHQNPT